MCGTSRRYHCTGYVGQTNIQGRKWIDSSKYGNCAHKIITKVGRESRELCSGLADFEVHHMKDGKDSAVVYSNSSVYHRDSLG